MLSRVAISATWQGLCLCVGERDIAARLWFLPRTDNRAFPTGPPLYAKKRSFPHTGSACIYPTIALQDDDDEDEDDEDAKDK